MMWAEELALGTEKSVYLEDNIFYEYANPYAGAANDCFDGGRIVFRRNLLIDDFFQGHGTDSSQRRRGCRSWEVYENFFNYTGNYHAAIYQRSGTGVVFNNTFTSTYNSVLTLINFRDSSSFFPWGKCDGSSPYDLNFAGMTGYRCVDQPAFSFTQPHAGDPKPIDDHHYQQQLDKHNDTRPCSIALAHT